MEASLNGKAIRTAKHMARKIMKSLKEIEALIEQKRYEEALLECDTLLQGASAGRVNEILRIQSHAFAMAGDYNRAIDIFETIFADSNGTMADYYQAAFNALYAEQFSNAEKWFKQVLHQGKEQGETWFESASLFYLSYAQMELGKHEEALRSLDDASRSEADIAMPLPKINMWTSAQLRSEIERRRE